MRLKSFIIYFVSVSILLACGTENKTAVTNYNILKNTNGLQKAVKFLKTVRKRKQLCRQSVKRQQTVKNYKR